MVYLNILAVTLREAAEAYKQFIKDNSNEKVDPTLIRVSAIK